MQEFILILLRALNKYLQTVPRHDSPCKVFKTKSGIVLLAMGEFECSDARQGLNELNLMPLSELKLEIHRWATLQFVCVWVIVCKVLSNHNWFMVTLGGFKARDAFLCTAALDFLGTKYQLGMTLLSYWNLMRLGYPGSYSSDLDVFVPACKYMFVFSVSPISKIIGILCEVWWRKLKTTSYHLNKTEWTEKEWGKRDMTLDTHYISHMLEHQFSVWWFPFVCSVVWHCKFFFSWKLIHF